MSGEELKKEVENKIKRFTLHAKNFTKEEMDRVDEYCKLNFGNDRKKMILSLISMVEDNEKFAALNDKINLLSNQMFEHLQDIDYRLNQLETKESSENEDKKEKKKTQWKGFSRGE